MLLRKDSVSRNELCVASKQSSLLAVFMEMIHPHLQDIEPDEFWDILGGPSEDPIPVS